jgi:hypothetical protein
VQLCIPHNIQRLPQLAFKGICKQGSRFRIAVVVKEFINGILLLFAIIMLLVIVPLY